MLYQVAQENISAGAGAGVRYQDDRLGGIGAEG